MHDLTVYSNIGDLSLERTVVAIGSFDGVHCGHQMLLRRVVDLAAQHQLRSVVLTFWPHPRQVLEQCRDVSSLLSALNEKISLLKHTGVDGVVVIRFDSALSQMTASDFVKEVVVGKLNAQYLVMGQDHHFGKDRSGNAEYMPDIAAHSGLQFEVIELKMSGRKISSSDIREALLSGALLLANGMLGYEYIISGKVVSGNSLGRTIGFPTANIEIPSHKLLPKNGVYRVKVKIDSGGFDNIGMLYIGKRSVLKQEDTVDHIEVNIFDFDQQVYGHEIELALTHRIRDDIKFENINQLATQLYKDKQKILNI